MSKSKKMAGIIEKLIDNGYGDIRSLSQQTGLSERQCRRYLDKFTADARYRFDNLMSKDYLYQYYNTLDNFSKTIQQCNEELARMSTKYDGLENKISTAVDDLDQVKHPIAHSAMLGQLIQVQNSREGAVVRLTAQRDKASDLKAKVFNAGPVVSALDQWVRNNTPKAGQLPELNMSDENNKAMPEEKKETISAEDQKVIDEMEKDENN